MRVGLVLGAGGLPGEAFHRGVLRALHDGSGIDGREADVVVGTCAGSLFTATLRARAVRGAFPAGPGRAGSTPARRVDSRTGA